MVKTGTGQAGTLESCDARVIIELTGEGGRRIDVDGPMKEVFGPDIRRVVGSVLERYGVRDARVKVIDRGALDYVLEARTTTALARARSSSGRTGTDGNAQNRGRC